MVCVVKTKNPRMWVGVAICFVVNVTDSDRGHEIFQRMFHISLNWGFPLMEYIVKRAKNNCGLGPVSQHM